MILCVLGAQTPARAQKIRAASGGLSVIHSLLWAPYEEKLMKKYGADLEYIAIESGTVGMQTLVANQSQFLFSTGSLAVNADLVGADVTIVAGGLNFIPDKLIARPEIKAPEDFKGKKIAISRFGSSSEVNLRICLEKLGVKPELTQIIQVGGVSTRQTALLAGQVDATILSDPQATAATKNGMKLMVDLSDSKWGFPRYCHNCFMAKRSYLESHREQATNFLKAVVEGLYLMKRDKPLAVRLIKKYLRFDDESASIGYDFYIAKHGEGLLSLPERRGLEFVIAEVAKTNPKAAGATPESLKLVEPSILEEIKKSGFIERVRG
jgi:ABC-type nitrate/sulfonate/bicarbonate transport system substrate-binding protein